jgi:hypothetical protein
LEHKYEWRLVLFEGESYDGRRIGFGGGKGGGGRGGFEKDGVEV